MLRLGQLAPQVYGIDIANEAARYWPQRGVAPSSSLASINELPFPSQHFDGVVSVDILECEGVEDRRAFAELVRITRPGGTVIVVVPAYQWMMTKGHHEAVHAVRRYNKSSLRALAEDLPLQIERVTHGFAALFPIIGGVRLLNRLQEQWGKVEMKSELQPLRPWVNQFLYGITNIERHLLRSMDMPFGSSLILVGRRV
jgi:SAM-dependent methyltransferase